VYIYGVYDIYGVAYSSLQHGCPLLEHMRYGITQCPAKVHDFPSFTEPIKADTRFSDSGRMQG